MRIRKKLSVQKGQIKSCHLCFLQLQFEKVVVEIKIIVITGIDAVIDSVEICANFTFNQHV